MKFFFILFLISSAVFSQENLSADEFFSIQDSAEHVVVLDVRPYEEYSEDRIAGALYAGEKMILIGLMENYHFDTPILLYCEYGKRSEAAMKLLKKEGFLNLYHLKKGYKDWKSKGFPVDDEKID